MRLPKQEECEDLPGSFLKQITTIQSDKCKSERRISFTPGFTADKKNLCISEGLLIHFHRFKQHLSYPCLT